MNTILRTPHPSEPETWSGTIQDICALIVVAWIVVVAAMVMP